MKARALAALAVVFLQPWLAANDRAISAISDPHVRATQRAVFARTQIQLRDAERAPSASAPGAPAIARAILADHRRFAFGSVQKPPPKTFWQRLEEWLGQKWESVIKALFGRVHLSGHVSVAIGDILLPLSLLAFLAIALRLAWQYGRQAEPAVPAAFGLDPAQSAAMLAAHAQRRAEAGDYNAAVALLFSAALRVLDDRGIVDAGDARTVGELRRAVNRRAPHVAAAFGAIAMLLSRAVYADALLSQADWETAAQAYATLKRVQGESDAA